MPKPKVSILIPVHNRKGFIADCIHSAVNQDYDNFEVVIVDNCSTDGTWKVCETFSKAHPNVHAYRNSSNVGPVKNWRICAEKATGEYSKILYSDDLISSDCVSRMVSQFVSDKIGLVCSNFQIGSSSSEFDPSIVSKKERVISRNRFPHDVMNGKVPVSPGGYMIRTSDILKYLEHDIPTPIPHDFKKHGAGPDVLLLMKTAEYYRTTLYIPDVLCFFRKHQGSITVSSRDFEIEKAYESTFLYFFRSQRSNIVTVSAASILWLRYLIRTRNWVSGRAFLQTHELSDALSYQILFYLQAIRHATLKIFERPMNKMRQSVGRFR